MGCVGEGVEGTRFWGDGNIVHWNGKDGEGAKFQGKIKNLVLSVVQGRYVPEKLAGK